MRLAPASSRPPIPAACCNSKPASGCTATGSASCTWWNCWPKFRQFCGAGNLACSGLSGGFFGHARVFDPCKRRLKAGGSQDWLPHSQVHTRYSACRRPLAALILHADHPPLVLLAWASDEAAARLRGASERGILPPEWNLHKRRFQPAEPPVYELGEVEEIPLIIDGQSRFAKKAARLTGAKQDRVCVYGCAADD